ncbi:hypothetical protein [Shewanella khirikhana]|uniref:RiboL-PSP-HEPN domain-containing protein n=1 Tax=Shewanella khirikhana TaxID=1965282 RepID=A0ABN5TUN5_9GAMM|nr:hypothetical protein [Shewanella khirikhana]AZQ11182.1 hypothetical protein STH12_02095 [Shewanella khirikhana]
MNIEIVKESRREVKTYVELMSGADSMLNKAESGIEGGYYCIMSALTLCAFSFEAYLNHIGIKHFDLWTKDARIPILEKYSIVCEKLSIESPDYSRGDCQRVRRLIRYRDTMAHGITQDLELKKPVKKSEGDFSFVQRSEWEKFTVLENAQKSIESTQRIINNINEAAGLGDYAFFSGHEVSRIEVKSLNK